jgi:hypothetical protein
MTSPTHGKIPAEKMPSPFKEPGSLSAVETTTGAYLLQMQKRQAEATERMARDAFNIAHPVDEYIYTPGLPSQIVDIPWGGTQIQAALITVQPTWEIPERIESILAGFPADIMQNNIGGSAGAAVSVQLVGAYSITGFDVSVDSSDTVAGEATVTLTGVISPALQQFGEALTWYIQENPAASETLSIRFPGAGLIALPGSTPTLSISAVTNGGIVAAELYGTPTVILTLGDRTINLSQRNGSNPVELDGLGIILTRDDERFMTVAPVPIRGGPYSLELMGYAHELYGNF